MSADRIEEVVAASIVDNLEREDRAGSSFIRGAIHVGLLDGFRRMRDAAKVRRIMRDDARRIIIHAQELLDWDVGDDGSTAAEMKEIGDRLANLYGLKIDGRKP